MSRRYSPCGRLTACPGFWYRFKSRSRALVIARADPIDDRERSSLEGAVLRSQEPGANPAPFSYYNNISDSSMSGHAAECGRAGAEPRKVLSLYWGYSIGGVGKYAVLLDRAAKRCGVSMEHVCIRGRAWQVDEGTLASLGATEILLNSRFDLSWVWRLCRHLRSTRPDLLMTHGFNGHFVAQFMRKAGCYHGGLISSYHGLYHSTTSLRNFVAPIFNAFTEWHVRQAAGTVVVAEHSKAYLLGKGVSPERVSVIHNGVEDVPSTTGSRARLRAEWGLKDDDIAIGVASRLDPVKGIDFLLDAFSRLASRHRNAYLVIVGTGTLDDALRKKTEKLHLKGRVRFTGFRSDIEDCLGAFDIFALPSLAEYHSIALLEAMRAGKAIVATDVGGNTESVRDAQEALVVKAEDSAGLERALDRLVSDAKLRSQLGGSARARYLSEFTEDEMLKRTGEWLRSRLSRPSAMSVSLGGADADHHRDA